MKTTAMKTKMAKDIDTVVDAFGQWYVRIGVPGFPFYLKSMSLYATEGQAEAVAREWRKRIIVVGVKQTKHLPPPARERLVRSR